MKFLDTNALLSGNLPAENFAISSITLKELENIKNFERKSDEVKYKARRALRDLDVVDHEVVTFQNKMLKPLKKLDLEINDDAKIVACACYLNKPYFYSKSQDIEFVTGDRACRNIAQLVLKHVTPVEEVKEEEYFGYREVMLTDTQMCDFYSNLGDNMFNLFVNEYVVIKDIVGNILDLYMWNGEEHKRIKTNAFFSNYFGEVKPLKDDIYQKMACDSLVRNKLTVLRGPAGTGKAQPNSTLIPTKQGYVKLGDIKVGDKILDRFGNETTVLAVYPQGLKDNYKITFSDDRIAYCNNEHLWSCYTSRGNFKNFTLQQMIDSGLQSKSGEFKYKIPKNEPIEYSEKNFEIDPYVIGAFLGDGCCKEQPLTISSNDEEIVAEISKLINAFEYSKESNKNYNWNFYFKAKTGLKGVKSRIQTEEFFKNYKDFLLKPAQEKSIPMDYKFGSIEQRFALIQGLMDTDGTIDNEIKGRTRFTSTSLQLIKDLQEICWSLGMSASISIDKRKEKYTNGICYTLTISCPKEIKPKLFRLTRKKSIALNYSNNQRSSTYSDKLTIKNIEKLPKPEEMTCILVDNAEHLYLTEQFIVTHNTYLGLGYLFALLDNGKIDKIIVFCNTVATKGSAKLGFYPGTRDEKLLDSQVGNLLASKLGDMIAVEKLIAEDKLLLLPVSDIRGFDSTGMNCGIYIDEAQNSTVEMMKLMLQRIGEDSVCVICGDDFTQVDMVDYEGANNGLKRLCQVFKNEPYFGTAYLKNCHRSKIAQKAEEM